MVEEKPKSTKKLILKKKKVVEKPKSPPRERTPPKARTPSPVRTRSPARVVEEKPKSTKKLILKKKPVQKPKSPLRQPSPPRARTPSPVRARSPPRMVEEKPKSTKKLVLKKKPVQKPKVIGADSVGKKTSVLKAKEVKKAIMNALDFGAYELIPRLYIDGQLVEENMRIGLDSEYPLLNALLYASSPDYHLAQDKERFIRDRVDKEENIIEEIPVNIAYAVLTDRNRAEIDGTRSVNKELNDSIIILEYETPDGRMAYNLIAPPVDVEGSKLISPVHLKEPVIKTLLRKGVKKSSPLK